LLGVNIVGEAGLYGSLDADIDINIPKLPALPELSLSAMPKCGCLFGGKF
jgi:hypothetical protein